MICAEGAAAQIWVGWTGGSEKRPAAGPVRCERADWTRASMSSEYQAHGEADDGDRDG